LADHTRTDISQLANREPKGFFKKLPPSAAPTCHRWGESFLFKKSPNLLALRKELLNTVLYIIYSMRFDVFSKNPGNTSAEIYEKQ
jgi:hypothetical protein